MPWYGWLMVGLIAISSFMVIAQTGQQRKPMEPITSAIVVFFNMAMIFGIVELGIH